MAGSITIFGTEWPIQLPPSPTRCDELLQMWSQARQGTTMLRFDAALVLACTPIGRTVGVAFDPGVAVEVYATRAMDFVHSSNSVVRSDPDKAPRAYATGKELHEAALAISAALTEAAPILEWEVAGAVGNSVPRPPS